MGQTLRIAIADDEPEVRHYFAEALASGGHEVVVIASDGRELVKRCRAARPDLLITDIRMDGLSGIQAMRELAEGETLPTILISAHYRREDLNGDLAGLESQVLAFLPKPVKLVDLTAAVDDAARKIL